MTMRLPRKNCFTLVELMVSMSIFAVLMLILMRIFGSVQDVWRKNGTKTLRIIAFKKQLQKVDLNVNLYGRIGII